MLNNNESEKELDNIFEYNELMNEKELDFIKENNSEFNN